MHMFPSPLFFSLDECCLFSDKYQMINLIGKYEQLPENSDEEASGVEQVESYFPSLEAIKEC